ncbi:MAG TPA: hypothetical protein VM598_14520 [Bdellovibrionota bacterium]|nr:hypothetical protein [Bdellovibrionota bacterium]
MRFRLILSIAALTTAAACGLKVHDDPPAQDPIEIDGVATGCLKGFSVRLGKFFEGEGPASDVHALGSCVDQALVTFSEKARGAQAGFYSAEELRRFLNRYFVADAPFHEAFWGELMKVKRAWVGGPAEGFTVAELKRTRELITAIARATGRLEPALPLWPFGPAESDPARVETGVRAARAFVDELAPELARSRSLYDLADSDALLREAEAWLGNPDPEAPSAKAVRSYRQRLPWARAAHVLWFPEENPSFAMGRAASQPIESAEWGPLLHLGVDLYELFWRADLAAAKPQWKRGSGRETWLDIARRARGLVGKILDRSPGRSLSFSSVNRALETAWPTGLVVGTNTVRTSSIQAAISTVLARVLAPGRAPTGIDSPMADQILLALERWSTGQAWLEQRFSGRERGKLSRAQLAPGQPNASQPASVQALLSMWPALPGALDPEATGRLQIPGNWSEVPKGVRLEEYESYLWRGELSHWLIRGYSANGAGSLKEPELVRFYQDARPLGIDLKFFDPVIDTAPAKRFRDANLFLFSSNGDDRLGVAEMTELLGFLFSGKRAGDDSHVEIAGQCQTGALDPYGYATIEPGCYREKYYGRFETHWARLPGLKRFFAGLSGAQRTELGRLLEESARKKTDPGAWFDSDDSEAIATLASYVEALFTRFDRNADGRIAGPEVEAAYDLVEGFLAKASCAKNASFRRAIFNYLLRNGRPPDRSWLGTLRFLTFWGTSVFRDFSADRLQLLRIFSELGKAQNQASCS